MTERPPNDYLLIRNGQLEKQAIERAEVIQELIFEKASLMVAINTYEIDKVKRELH